MSKPRLSDVRWLSVTLRPQTYCEPPAGQSCHLETPSVNFGAADAKRHAFDHPGHRVLRDAITRTSYLLPEPEDEQ